MISKEENGIQGTKNSWDVEEDEEDIEILYYVPQLKFDEVKRNSRLGLRRM